MQTRFQFLLVLHSLRDLGTVTSFLCSSLLCSVKRKPAAPTSEAEATSSSTDCHHGSSRGRSGLAACQALVQALYMSCHLVITQPSEVNTTILLVSQMRKLRLKVM